MKLKKPCSIMAQNQRIQQKLMKGKVMVIENGA
jgi:hypothetical protein